MKPDLLYKSYTYLPNASPLVSVVIPAFNQALQVNSILDHLSRSMTLPYELILVDDNSEDNTAQTICEWLTSDVNQNFLVRASVYKTESPVFETASDNIGFRAATADYIIELQSDIFIHDPGFDRRMISALNELSLSAVSGRMVHLYAAIDSRKRFIKYPLKAIAFMIRALKLGAGRMSSDFFSPLPSVEHGVCYVGETVARGPWLLKRSDLVKYGYLDDAHFFLGCDDHDFHRRVYQQERRMPGYVPINCWSPERGGATRRKRAGKNLDIYNALKNTHKGSPGFNAFLRDYKPFSKIVRMSYSIQRFDI